MTTKPTTEQIKATLETLRAVADAIRELKTVPSGVLYARVMGHFNFETYKAVIGTLVRAGLVKEHDSHLLEWVGPAKESEAAK
jgi:effector-binding domain-containing protein